MNIDELKMILDAVQSVSGMGANVAYWYLGLHILDQLLSVGVGIAVMYTFFISLRYTLRCFSASERLREASDVYSHFSNEELAKACAILREHYNK